MIFLKVFAGNNTPYFYFSKKYRQCYIRVGNSSIPASHEQLRELYFKGSGYTYDSLKSGIDFNSVTFKHLRKTYKRETGIIFDDNKDFGSMGIIDKDGDLTNGGALVVDDADVKHSILVCTRWNGFDKAGGLVDALDYDEYEGGLTELLDAGLSFVSKNTHHQWRKDPRRRVELPDYPERALQEGLVNALIHRDYTVLGGEVHLDIYDDRLTISNPGGMYNGINVQDQKINTIESRRRNPILAEIFTRLRLMEKRGSGFKKIENAYKESERYTKKLKPEFFSNETSFILTLWNLNYEYDKASRDALNDALTIENKVIELIKSYPYITQIEMANRLSVSKPTIQRAIKSLTDNNTIKREDSKKSGYWVIL